MTLYGDYKLEMQTKSVSRTSLQRFIDSHDIGSLQQIDGHSDVTRTVTSLLIIIFDLILNVAKLKENKNMI